MQQSHALIKRRLTGQEGAVTGMQRGQLSHQIRDFGSKNFKGSFHYLLKKKTLKKCLFSRHFSLMKYHDKHGHQQTKN